MSDAPLAPYREPPKVARWVCIACHRSLSTLAGICPRCQVERLDLTRPDVREEVQQYAERLVYHRMIREELVLGGIGGGVGIVVGWTLMMAFADWAELGWGRDRLLFLVGLSFGLLLRTVLLRAYLKLRPHAGIAVYAARRRRHALALGVDAMLLHAPTDVAPGSLSPASSNIDPEVADLDQLLRRLGATLDE